MERGSRCTPRMFRIIRPSYISTHSCSSVKAHPTVQFTVIVNPNSGPGSGELPDEAFLAEVPKLNAYDNVRTVGYVKTGWAEDDLNTVLAEIATYAAWASKANDPLMGVDGIFFDETPSEYDDAKHEWLNTAVQAVKTGEGFGDKTVGMLTFRTNTYRDSVLTTAVLNPGTISGYTDIADISVEFEKGYDQWKTDGGLTDLQAEGLDPSKVAIIMYSLPESALEEVVKEAEGTAQWFFLTSDDQAQGYLGFSTIFANFVASVDDGKTR